jgi:hypothetical protein
MTKEIVIKQKPPFIEVDPSEVEDFAIIVAYKKDDVSRIDPYIVLHDDLSYWICTIYCKISTPRKCYESLSDLIKDYFDFRFYTVEI